MAVCRNRLCKQFRAQSRIIFPLDIKNVAGDETDKKVMCAERRGRRCHLLL